MGEAGIFGSSLSQLKQTALDLGEELTQRPLFSTALVRAFGLAKIPMLWWIRPTVVELNDERCVVKIPLNRRTRNHVKVMYIGVLVAGIDMAAGLGAMRRIQTSGANVHLLFKDLKVDFKKRVEGDAYFTCDRGAATAAAVEETLATGERINLPTPVTVTVPSALGDTPAAEAVITLSLRKRA